MKALVYARYSSDMQREESIEAQLKAIHDYAAKKDITIIKEYVDRATSGRRASERAAFLDMMRDVKSSGIEIEYVLVHKSNRFARNREESALYKHKLRKHGVKVIAVAQDFGEGPHTVILEAVLEGLDEYQSLDLANETMKGLMVNASKCQYNGGRVLYGYQVNGEKQYEINPREAQVVQDIYKKILNGWSYVDILHHLEAAGVRNRSGKTFGKNSLHDMLRNERYAGVYLFNEHPRRHPVTGKRTSRMKNPDTEIVRVPGGMPQIVPREQWEQVQYILDGRKQQTQRRNRKYLLTGYITCGVCGNAYTGVTTITKYTEKGYYRCTRKAIKAGECNNSNISQETTDRAAIELVESLLAGISVTEMVSIINRIYEEESTEQQAEQRVLTEELKAVNRKIDNLLDVIEEGGATDMVKARLQDNSTLKSQIETRLQEIKRACPRVTEAQVRAELNTLTLADAQSIRSTFARIGLHVTVQPGPEVEYTLGKKKDSLHNGRVTSPTPLVCKLLADLLRKRY